MKNLDYSTLKERLRNLFSAKSEANKVTLFVLLLKDTLLKDSEEILKVEDSVRKNGVFIGRVDLSIGKVLIEFKKSIRKKTAEEQGLSEIKKYFSSDEYKDSIIAILTDGKIYKVYDRNLKLIDKFEAPNPSSPDFNKRFQEFLLKLDRYILSNRKLPVTSDCVVEIFGIGSSVFNKSVLLLEKSFNNLRKEGIKEVSLYLEQWKNFMSVIYGNYEVTENLFFRHTYLNILVKLIAYNTLKKYFGIKESLDDYRDVITGKLFKDFGINNYIEEDFFMWIIFDKDLVKKLGEIIEKVIEEKFDFTNVSEDVLKDIYENIVIEKERHDSGEYYTPDWLAKEVLIDILGKDSSNYKKTILDPSCGSGTFLFKAIHLKKEKLSDQFDNNTLLKHILDTIIGFDINPIAVIIARTNYLIALGELLKDRDSDISIPIYNADSFRVPLTSQQLSLGYGQSVVINLYGEYLEVPYCETDLHLTDSIVEAIVSWADKYSSQSFKTYLRVNYPEVFDYLSSQGSIPIAKNTARKLEKIIRRKGNNIWAYIIKNIFKPVVLKNKIDIIVGNPPWLAYRYLKKEMQDYVKKLMNEFGITIPSKLMTHMEVATLFYVVASYEYLKFGGKIGFVSPASIFTGDQQAWFRTKFLYKNFYNKITKLYDLTDVSGLFRIPCGVVFGEKENVAEYTGEIIRIRTMKYSGSLPKRNLELEEVGKYITEKETITGLVKLSDSRQYWIVGAEPEDLSNFQNKYRKLFKQGATINPRRLWFVKVQESNLGCSKSKIPVESDTRETDKILIEPLKGTIPEKYIYRTIESRTICPFGYCNESTVVLPLEINLDKLSGKKFFSLVKSEDKHIPENLRSWLKSTEQIWERVKKKTSKIDVYQRLNYRNGLLDQDPSAKFISLYTTSGKNIASLVIENDGKFVANSKTYYAYFDNMEEAYYISAILNSNVVNKAIKPFQSLGVLGERDIHTLPLELPIPDFDSKNQFHRRISELGRTCESKINDGKIKEFICSNDEKRRRGLGRYVLDFGLNEIDRILYEKTDLKVFAKEPKSMEGLALFNSLDIEDFKEEIKRILKQPQLIKELEKFNLSLNPKEIYPAELTYRRYNPIDFFNVFNSATELLNSYSSLISLVSGTKNLIETLIFIYIGLGKLKDFLKGAISLVYRYRNNKVKLEEFKNKVYLTRYVNGKKWEKIDITNQLGKNAN